MNLIIPKYLYEKSNIVKLILFTSVFALMFINIFEPFGSRNWYPYTSNIKYLFFSSLIILIGMLVVVVSRMIMYKYGKKHSITYWQYATYIFCEIIAMSIFYTLFAKFIPEAGENRDILDIFRQSIVNTILVLLIPYSMSWLYFSWRDKKIILEHIKHNDESSPIIMKNQLAFFDEKGKLKISIMVENLLYIESTSNYLTIFYLNKSKLTQFLLRNSLKWVEKNMTNDTSLERCHRSYIVNLEKVKVLQRTKNGIFIEFDAENTPKIPVSKTYYERFMSKFFTNSNV